MIIFNADNGAETVHVDWMRQDYGHDASGGWRGMKDNQICDGSIGFTTEQGNSYKLGKI
jgi:hypothetical protein